MCHHDQGALHQRFLLGSCSGLAVPRRGLISQHAPLPCSLSRRCWQAPKSIIWVPLLAWIMQRSLSLVSSTNSACCYMTAPYVRSPLCSEGGSRQEAQGRRKKSEIEWGHGPLLRRDTRGEQWAAAGTRLQQAGCPCSRSILGFDSQRLTNKYPSCPPNLSS